MLLVNSTFEGRNFPQLSSFMEAQLRRWVRQKHCLPARKTRFITTLALHCSNNSLSVGTNLSSHDLSQQANWMRCVCVCVSLSLLHAAYGSLCAAVCPQPETDSWSVVCGGSKGLTALPFSSCSCHFLYSHHL